tara:strand:- start:5754 stop:5993 length:240 start_codon:yes stop_codon:yes gene_type:complete
MLVVSTVYIGNSVLSIMHCVIRKTIALSKLFPIKADGSNSKLPYIPIKFFQKVGNMGKETLIKNLNYWLKYEKSSAINS